MKNNITVQNLKVGDEIPWKIDRYDVDSEGYRVLPEGSCTCGCNKYVLLVTEVKDVTTDDGSKVTTVPTVMSGRVVCADCESWICDYNDGDYIKTV